jgi:hypothetical protein
MSSAAEKQLASDRQFIKDMDVHAELEKFVMASLKARPANIYGYMVAWANVKLGHEAKPQAKKELAPTPADKAAVEKQLVSDRQFVKDMDMHAVLEKFVVASLKARPANIYEYMIKWANVKLVEAKTQEKEELAPAPVAAKPVEEKKEAAPGPVAEHKKVQTTCTRGHMLIKEIIEALENGDEEAYTDACMEYDSIVPRDTMTRG